MCFFYLGFPTTEILVSSSEGNVRHPFTLVFIFVFLLSFPESLNDRRHRFNSISSRKLRIWIRSWSAGRQECQPWIILYIIEDKSLLLMTWSKWRLRVSILGAVTAASRLCSKEASQGEAKEGKYKGAKDKGEETQNHCILNWGCIEGKCCGTITANGVEPKQFLDRNF